MHTSKANSNVSPSDDITSTLREAETRIVCQLYDWHARKYQEACDLALTAGNGIAGAHASAHSASMDYCRALIEGLKGQGR